MRTRLEIAPGELTKAGAALHRALKQLQESVEMAMANRFWLITQNNLGDMGEDRPIMWPPLSPDYAKRVGRKHATLFVSGKLAAAIKVETDSDGAAVVARDADVPYATVHQYGGGNNVPMRPYFPVDAIGRVMPYTEEQCMLAGQEEAERLLAT